MNEVITSVMVGELPGKYDSFPWSVSDEDIRRNLGLLSKQLLPCPFCGAKPIVQKAESDGIKVTCGKCYIPKVVEWCDDFCQIYHKRTKQKHTAIPWRIPLAGTMNKIIKRWNQRITK